MLIEMAGAEGIPRVEFGGDAQMHEPVVLQRFPEIARRVRGHVRADLGDAFQFLPALRIDLALRQFARFLRMAFRKADQRVGADVHRAQFLLFRIRLRIVQVIELAQALRDVLLKVEQAFAIDLVVQHGVAGRALFHEFGEDAGFVSGFPFVGHFGKEQLAHGAPLPERDDLVAIQLARFGADRKRNLLARVEDVQVLQAVAAQFGISRRGFGRGAFFADDQFIGADEDRLVLHQILKRQRAAQGADIRPVCCR